MKIKIRPIRTIKLSTLILIFCISIISLMWFILDIDIPKYNTSCKISTEEILQEELLLLEQEALSQEEENTHELPKEVSN